MDTREELARDQWIQDHLYECETCKWSLEESLMCEQCDGSLWVERNWAEERKKMIQANMEMMKRRLHENTNRDAVHQEHTNKNSDESAPDV